jgi:twitching motility protein PilI
MSELTSDQPLESVIATRAGARRTRLREFQSQLVERMQAVRSGAEAQPSMLGLLIGQTRWLLDLPEAGEIVAVGDIAGVPLTKDWYLGLTNIRGNLTGVIDLARFHGMAPTPINKESRIVAFSPALAFNCSLLVSRVLGLRKTTEMEVQTASGDADVPWSANRYVDRDAQLWHELKLSEIVKDPQFLHVGI